MSDSIPRRKSAGPPRQWWLSTTVRTSVIAALALTGIAAHLALRFLSDTSPALRDLPLYIVLAAGGVPLVLSLALKLVRRQFGSDLLAGISIVSAALLGEYLAGAFVVLMLSGGEALEAFALGRASSVLQALAKRMPLVAHRRADQHVVEVPLAEVRIGDELIVYPHEICPVDAVVIDGHGVMDESYLTGEPFMRPKARGSEVFSGAINGENALTVRASRLAVDSRYARIMNVMRDSEQRRPQLRRLGDQLGAWYTPIALAIAMAAWTWSGEPVRFLAVIVVATPCPLLIGIPVAIIGAISLAAKRGIIIRDPGGPRAHRRMPHHRPRQDRHIDVRETHLDRPLAGAGHGRRDGAAVGGEPGTIFEASVGRTDPRGGRASGPGVARRERGS